MDTQELKRKTESDREINKKKINENKHDKQKNKKDGEEQKI